MPAETMPTLRLDGKVAFVTGAARGQGRSHAVQLADLGADVALVDICREVDAIPYSQGTEHQLDETVALVEATGRRALRIVADVRDATAMADAMKLTIATFDHVDIVVANAGVIQLKAAVDITPADWSELIAINLTGVWNTVSPALSPMISRGTGGSIIITSSAAGVKGPPNMAHYSASKSGLVGLTRSLATEMGPHSIRVNCIAPSTVDTDMVHWPQAYQMFRPDIDKPCRADVVDVFTSLNVLPVPWILPSDVSNAVTWLACDESRYVTGIVLPVDAGTLLK